ncbi:acyltransferase, partial [Providencia sp. wls1949]
NKIRNMFFSYIFKTTRLKVGKNISLCGTKNITIGNNVLLGNQTWLDCIGNGRINIGDNVSFSQNVHIAANSFVRIGSGCLIGSDVLITDHDHSYGKNFTNIMPKNRILKTKGSTEIGENSWISDNVKILSGVKLGSNIVVAANSVVTHDFPSNVVIGGIPAKILKTFE